MTTKFIFLLFRIAECSGPLLKTHNLCAAAYLRVNKVLGLKASLRLGEAVLSAAG